jgi:hypothetical protein
VKVLAVLSVPCTFPIMELFVKLDTELPEPSINFEVNPVVEPLKEIPQELAMFACVDRALITRHKSVNVLGIEVKSIEAAPPLPTVEDAISSNVFAIMPPLFRRGLALFQLEEMMHQHLRHLNW